MNYSMALQHIYMDSRSTRVGAQGYRPEFTNASRERRCTIALRSSVQAAMPDRALVRSANAASISARVHAAVEPSARRRSSTIIMAASTVNLGASLRNVGRPDFANAVCAAHPSWRR